MDMQGGFFVRERIKNFFLRMVTGLVLILALNFVFAQIGLPLAVGINPITAAASGLFGVPGVVMLYGIVGCGLG